MGIASRYSPSITDSLPLRFSEPFFSRHVFQLTSRVVWSATVAPEVLAFYYGWYGNPQVSGEWRHWKNVDPVNLKGKANLGE